MQHTVVATGAACLGLRNYATMVLWNTEVVPLRERRRSRRPVSGAPATASPGPSWTTDPPPPPTSRSASGSPRPRSAAIWTLHADNVVEPRDQRVYGHRGRGRPAKVFALTDCGRDA